MAAPNNPWHLAWQPSELVPGFAEDLASIPGVGAVSMVRVGDARIASTATADGTPVDAPGNGFVIPVEVHAFDAAAHSQFVPAAVEEAFLAMADDEVMLGSTSARLRRLDVGDVISFDNGLTVSVAGVVDDAYVGDAEIVTTRRDPGVFADMLDKYAVFTFRGDGDLLVRQANDLIDGEPIVIRSWGEVEVFRHGDFVRSQVAFKDRFGEFTIRLRRGGFDQEPAWREANIASETLPLLGEVTCHRQFIAILRGVMEALEAAGNADVIDQGAFAGCWNARFIAGRQAISHHSFGAAADINFFNALDGPQSPQHPALIAAMEAAGVTSGHQWVNPDPGHFEWFEG
jgi:hypothetical protein